MTDESGPSPAHIGGVRAVIIRTALQQLGEGLEAAIRRDLDAVIATELEECRSSGEAQATGPAGRLSLYAEPCTGPNFSSAREGQRKEKPSKS